MKSTFNAILNRICTALFGDSRDKVLYFIERLDNALREKFAEASIMYFSPVTLENSDGGIATVNHSHFYQERGERVKENAKINLPKDELPKYLREKLAAAFGEVDITTDVEREIATRKSVNQFGGD